MFLVSQTTNIRFDQGIVTGWGATQEHGDVSVTLMEVTVPIQSNKECRESGYGSSRITDNMLCAGFKEGKKDSCQGIVIQQIFTKYLCSLKINKN